MSTRILNWSSERAQILPLAALMMALAGVLLLVLGQMGSRAIHISQAEAKAEMTALAGASAGEAAAVEISRANGAELVSIEQSSKTKVKILSKGFLAEANAINN